MRTLIEEIWDGDYRPSEAYALFGEEIMRASRLLDEKERELWERLTKENRDLFDEVMRYYYDMVRYYRKESFIQGARFVGRVLKEI